MQPLKIAFRNVSRQRKRGLLLGSAIAFGFFVFTLVNGFTGGLLTTVEGNIAGALGGHIYVSGSEVSAQGSELSMIRDTGTLDEALTVIQDQVASTTTRSSANSSLTFSGKEETQMLEGIDAAAEGGLLGDLTFVQGSAQAFLDNDNALLLPVEVIEDLGAEVGESVIVKTTTISGQQNVGDFVIAGSLEVQAVFGSSAGYAHLGALNTLLGMEPGQYQTLNIELNDLSQLEPATTALYDELARLGEVSVEEAEDDGPGGDFGLGSVTSVDEADRWSGTKFAVTNLNDATTELTTLVSVLQTSALVIFLIIIGIIMVGIMNSYRMVMLERTSEIGTMRAMGVQRSGIRNIFLWEAFLIALGGALAGLAAAFSVMGGVGLFSFNLGAFGFFLDNGHVRFAITVLGTLGNIALLCVMSIAAVYVPARSAANLRPAEALRA